MIEEKEFRNIMLYIIDRNGHTLIEAAKHFKKKRNEIKEYVNRLNDPNDKLYDEALAQIVNEKLEEALKTARSKAGSMSRKANLISQEDALELRYKHVYLKVPLRELGEQKGCSFMTISNAIKALPKELIKEQDHQISLSKEIEEATTY